MSSALRIASVTHVLRDLLNNGLIDNNVSDTVQGSITVTVSPPDKIDTAIDSEKTQLNLFMYQVSYNQGWRNVGQPTFNQKGERVGNPPLAIDLHYLLTAYGSKELHTEILLGYGMQVFHETMVLDRDAIKRSIGSQNLQLPSNLPDSLKILSTSDLADQVEQIKITPEILSIEDISKLWAAFGAKYRPTAAYKVTVVLIESNKSTKPGLPVKDRNIYVKTFRKPVIEKILSQSAIGQPVVEGQKILSGNRLILSGKQFNNEKVEISIDGLSIIAANLIVDDKEISFDLPTNLKSGIHEIQIVHPVLMGTPPVDHNGVMSNVLSFVLSPSISNVAVSSKIVNSGFTSATIQFKLNPFLFPGQRGVLLLNEMVVSDAASYSFQIPNSILLSPPQSTEIISLPISGVKSGKYLLRVMIDDADSPLTTDATGKFDSPQIDLS